MEEESHADAWEKAVNYEPMELGEMTWEGLANLLAMPEKMRTRVRAVFLFLEGFAACKRAIAMLQMDFTGQVTAPLIDSVV